MIPAHWMLLLVPVALGTQGSDAAVPGCGCGDVFAFVSDYVERNYAGFPDKVQGRDRPRYEEHKIKIRGQAREASTEAECHALLVEYIGFFRDRHLGVSYQTASTELGTDDDAIRARFADWPVRHVSEPEVRGYLDRPRDDVSPIEGIWEMINADYRLAILRDEATDGRYEAVVLSADSIWWVPGQIKATFEQTAEGEYRADYYMQDHSLREDTARLRQGVLAFSGASSWARVHPENSSGYDPERYRASMNRELAVRALDPNTLLLQLPDFGPTVGTQIDSLVEANWDRLTSARNLVIDVRGNPGGSNASFRSLLPLLYTGPVVTPAMSLYATDDNIRSFETVLENTDFPEDVEGAVRAMIARMREHRGAFVPASDDTLRLDGTLPHPDNIAVVTDRWCASSCESLVWAALQSEKATVFGENTGGFLDYGEVLTVETSCPAFQLHNPTARSNRVLQGAPLDNVGIEPDVRIPQDVIYWVDWVHQQLRSY